MKKLLLLAFLIPFFGISQNYIDLLKIGYSQSFNNEFEGFDDNTTINSIDVDLTFPIVLNDKNDAIVTGITFSKNRLNLFPSNTNFESDETNFGTLSETTSLYNTILKLGYAKNFSEKWSGTFVVLPKLASDYVAISSEDFYIGGAVLFKYKKKENLTYRFGLYAMGQAFGLFTTPILGFYYISSNKKFEMDIVMPVSADINYKIGKNTKVGFDYYAIGRSFDIHKKDAIELYTDYVALEFTGYFQYCFLDNSVLLRTKLGYSSNSAEIYENEDKIDFRVSAFDFGENRNVVSPELSGGIFAKLEAVYRFDLSKETPNPEIE